MDRRGPALEHAERGGIGLHSIRLPENRLRRVQPEPLQVEKVAGDELGTAAGPVDVFDAHQKAPACPGRHVARESCRKGVPQVQIAGGAGGEAGDDGHARLLRCCYGCVRGIAPAWPSPPAGGSGAAGRASLDPAGETPGIERRADFCIVIEEDEDIPTGQARSGSVDDTSRIGRLAARRPCRHPVSPEVERRLVVAAGIQHFRAVETAVDEIGGDVHQPRPSDRVGADEGYVVGTKEVYELGGNKARVADFDRMPERAEHVRFGKGSPLQPLIVPASESRGGCAVPGQQAKERLQS